MFYKVYIPQYPLSQFIVSFWYGENAPEHSFERLLPNGDMDLVMNLCDAKLRFYGHSDLHHPECFTGPIVSGAHSDYYVIDTFQQTSLIGVKFRPGGAYPFLGDSADRLHNLHVALEDLWGQSAIELQARLMAAKTYEARFHCLEKALLHRLSDTIRPHAAIAHAVSAFVAQQGISSVATVTRETGLSSRRFIEVFRREVGLPPKTFCRILRFQRALQLIRAKSAFGLTGLALDCGYYDQAHFIRDFKDLAGITPTAYLAAQDAYDNHVHLTE